LPRPISLCMTTMPGDRPATPSWIALGLILAATVAVSAAGGAVTTPEIGGWYRTLEKPPFNPPDWLFGPVWTLLYLAMAVAAWLVWRARGGWRAARGPLALYGVQLALNLGWSVLFFGLHRPDLAFAEIVLLWAAILATAVAFSRASRAAGLLMLPYLAWVGFAAVLNGWIWLNN